MAKEQNILNKFITKENLVYFICGFVLAVNLAALSAGFYFYHQLNEQRKAIIVNQAAIRAGGLLK